MNKNAPIKTASSTKPQPDRETQALLHWVTQATSTPLSRQSPQTARENYRNALAKTDIEAPKVASIENIFIKRQTGDQLNLRLYRPFLEKRKKDSKLPAVLFFHGGGCVFGDLDTHEPLCCQMCADSEAVVISVDYRLSPEHNFPAPIEDGVLALDWLTKNADKLGIDSQRVVLSGDSAGGGAATSVIQECHGSPNHLVPCAQLLIYPALDITAQGASRKHLADMFPVDATTLEWFYSHYFGATWPLHDNRAHPIKYPKFANVPALIMTAGLDPLKDEALAYGQKMQDHGVQVHYLSYDGTIHGFMGMGRLLRRSHRAARQDIADFLQLHF